MDESINYIDCPIHGHQKSTKQHGMCDKCYAHEQYLKRKELLCNTYCMIHGLRAVNMKGECRECIKQRKIQEEFFNKN